MSTVLTRSVFVLLLLMSWTNFASAHRNPITCNGSALNILLFTASTPVHVGDTITYDVSIFNGTSATPISCNATVITASVTTPDGILHAIMLKRTSLSNLEMDNYPAIVSYVVRAQDVRPDGTVRTTAKVDGTIHQNDTDSGGGGDQEVNTEIINTLNIIKTVINDNDGTAVSADFSINVKTAAGAHVSGSPAVGVVSPGRPYSTLTAGTYVVSETTNASYTQSFSGDCDTNGSVTIAVGDSKTCTITNNDIAPPPPSGGGGGGGGGGGPLPVPIIGIAKVPEPLALSTGPGLVTYDYTVSNPGTQLSLVNVTVADDKCSPVVFLSGDLNSNLKLDLAEKWKYSCTTTLATTTTNTVTTVGYGDDGYRRSTTATAVATVVVSTPLPSPTIHIEKVPNRLTPFPFGGGEVIYTYTVTNTGVLAMHDVVVTDDKCSPVSSPFGDINNDSLLDISETWIYTCKMNIPVTTVNVATALGTANGFTVSSVATATVQVATPGFPKTGFAPAEKITLWTLIMNFMDNLWNQKSH